MSLPGTANTLTVMAKDCDLAMEAVYPEQLAQSLSFESNRACWPFRNEYWSIYVRGRKGKVRVK